MCSHQELIFDNLNVKLLSICASVQMKWFEKKMNLLQPLKDHQYIAKYVPFFDASAK